MHSLTTVQFSAHHAEHSLVQYPLSRTQYRLSRTQYRLSRTQYPPQQNAVPPQQNAVPPQQAFVPAYDPYDHTAEFDPKDISDNKVFAMLCYLMDFIGIIVALLATHSSKYTMFHVRQALKITVVSVLSVFVLIIPFLGWIAFPILQGIIWVIKIISFFQICSGKAKEPAIIKSFGFLR